jgi:hypothetical protein
LKFISSSHCEPETLRFDEEFSFFVQSALNVAIINTPDSYVKTQSACSRSFFVVRCVITVAAQRITAIARKTI